MIKPARDVRKKVSRKQWGAEPWDCFTRVFTAKGFVIHYSGALADRRKDHSECDDVVRSFLRFHKAPGGLGVPDGGCDIAYSHVICPHGNTYVCRGFQHQTGANGTAEANAEWPTAVCIIGGDREGRRDFTSEQRESLRVYRRRFRTLHPLGWRIRFHSSFKATGCPGDEIRAFARREWPKATEAA